MMIRDATVQLVLGPQPADFTDRKLFKAAILHIKTVSDVVETVITNRDEPRQLDFEREPSRDFWKKCLEEP